MRRLIGVVPLVLLTFLAVGFGGHASADNAADKRRHTEATGEQGTEKGKRVVRLEEKRRHTEAAGGFSFIPPEGWEIRDFPGLKFKVAVGPAAAGFAPNINVVDESFDGSLDDYVKGSLNGLSKVFKKYRLVKQDNFKTASGPQGLRALIENEQNDRLLRQTFYFFSNKKIKLILTCTALAERGDKLAPVFEASMKTFRLDAQ